MLDPVASPSPSPVLPALRQDLQLFPGPAHEDGAPSWRIHDPVRNKFFEIGWLEFELLSRWRGGVDIDTLCEETQGATALAPTPEEVGMLLAFLRQHQLVLPDAADRAVLERRWLAGQPGWASQLLHHYLFFRVPLLHPDAFLTRTLSAVQPFFTRRFLLLTMLAGIAGLYLATRQADALTHAFSYFFSLEGLVCYGVAATVGKVIHELGHAYTAKRMGLRVPTMGVAFLVMWPVLYTDTGEAWKLASPSRRFAVASAGIASELVLAAWTTLAWALTPDGVLRSMFFLLATSTWLLTLALNASPFMRFDGYFLLSDALDMPNLHERAGTLARAALRRALFGLQEPESEPAMSAARQRCLIAFAVITWLYRLVLFLGIALTVYHLFFKLLGIVLMGIEIGWFILRPVGAELRLLWRRRNEWRLRAGAWAAVVLVLGMLLWLFPLTGELSAPALARGAEVTTLYPPAPARVVRVLVKNGQAVAAGQPLVEMESPELASRAERARLRAAGLAEELSRTPANALQRERRTVLEDQLAEAQADASGAAEEIARLAVRAPHAGVVRDVPDDLVAERWIGPRQFLLRVVQDQRSEIDAYIGERMLEAVRPGQQVRFYPDRSDRPVVRGKVVAIDTAAGRTVLPLLASTYGGPVATIQSGRGALVAHEALYRVRIEPLEGEASAPQMLRGTVRIDADWQAVGWDGAARALSVLIREAGF